MESRKKVLAAAISGLMSGTVLVSGCASWSNSDSVKGECHGVNSCKGTGDCGGKGHGCGGKNACKGMGWKDMTHKECKKLDGKFQKK